MSTKRELLTYLGFLRDNGYLYVETHRSNEAIAQRPQASVSSMVKTPMGNLPPHPSQPADAVQTDLFGAPLVPATRLAASAAPPPATPLPGEALPRAERIRRLAELAAAAEACRACALGSTRHKLVFADGEPEARLAFVGEAPGADEDASGIPFVGRAGQLLNKMLAAIGFRREEVYICNTLKCRPPENRDPLPGEKAACEHFLIEQLRIVRPLILVALGNHAAQYLCRSTLGIGKLRGRWYVYHGIPLLPTFHPAFLLRPTGAKFKPQGWEDFQSIHAKYLELNPGDPRPLWNK